MKIVADSHIPYINDYFGAYGDLILLPGREITAHDVRDADVLIVRSITHVNEKLLADSKVKFVGSVTAGADHLDTQWLNAAGITWSVAPGFNAPPVADYVLSTVAALQRKGLLARDGVKAAVIGVGHVGRLVVDRFKLLNFDMTLCDPIRAVHEPDFDSTTLDQIEDVDLITLHVPLIKHGAYPTYHFIDEAFLKRQKPGCILLNACRGSVINTQDLLNSGRHLHWCFDVWEHEPRINKHVLDHALIATPHIAGYSVQSKIRGIDKIYSVACEKQIITPQAITPIEMPTQTLAFAGAKHYWQDIVLGIFNPLVITAMMRTILLPEEECGQYFDEMRNQFNYRHEIAYTHVVDGEIPPEDVLLLQKIGMS